VYVVPRISIAPTAPAGMDRRRLLRVLKPSEAMIMGINVLTGPPAIVVKNA